MMNEGKIAEMVAPSRVRGLKQFNHGIQTACQRRTLTGAWIETFKEGLEILFTHVAPSRVRGLKLIVEC